MCKSERLHSASSSVRRSIFLRPGESAHQHRYCCVSMWSTVNEYALHGPREQRDGILSKRMVRVCWLRPICLPLDGKSIRDETSGCMVGSNGKGVSIPQRSSAVLSFS
ncbi:PREDICTED: uncharacterized protein LOC109241030 [Nicotiana attenuata]|uniref:uncharacterized protein LOC109241030 n=1 Tax=Nicotiana attenuata TaxID=49451 RepID=UPI00090586D2|nr:PREDICTED: uncharacterized protein LOC109241030 [Nicotiana attenuata]